MKCLFVLLIIFLPGCAIFELPRYGGKVEIGTFKMQDGLKGSFLIGKNNVGIRLEF